MIIIKKTFIVVDYRNPFILALQLSVNALHCFLMFLKSCIKMFGFFLILVTHCLFSDAIVWHIIIHW